MHSHVVDMHNATSKGMASFYLELLDVTILGRCLVFTREANRVKLISDSDPMIIMTHAVIHKASLLQEEISHIT